MNREISSFIDKYVKELINNNAAVFIGAGFSTSVGFVDWKNLLSGIAEDLGLNIERESDLVSLAQYSYNRNRNRSLINDIIFEEFSKEKTIDENHKLIAKLPISTYWTTNYDSLIEDALLDVQRVVDVKYDNSHLSITRPHRDAIVYKMHGDRSNPDNAILIKDDYENYYKKHAQFITALSGDLISKTFLFLGFSFTDPNIDYILSRIRIDYDKQNNRQHFTIMRKIRKKDYPNLAEFEYAQRKHEFFVEDLKRYNIRALLIDDYSEITDILNEINRRLSYNNVFISGSASNYGIYSEEEAIDLIINLSKELIKNDYNIISGFGLGVGSAVITGALQEIYMNEKKINDNRLLLRPFPQGILDDTSRQKIWKKYREDMISRAGISIFLFGNKSINDEVVLANGMKDEYEIALDNKNLIIPIGCTGYVAEKIWVKIQGEIEYFYGKKGEEIKYAFAKLNDKVDNETLVSNVLAFINLLRKR